MQLHQSKMRKGESEFGVSGGGGGERGGKTEKKVQGETGGRKSWGVVGCRRWLGKEEKEDDVGVGGGVR